MISTDTSDTLAIRHEHRSIVHDLTTGIQLLNLRVRARITRETTRLRVLLELQCEEGLTLPVVELRALTDLIQSCVSRRLIISLIDIEVNHLRGFGRELIRLTVEEDDSALGVKTIIERLDEGVHPDIAL